MRPPVVLRPVRKPLLPTPDALIPGVPSVVGELSTGRTTRTACELRGVLRQAAIAQLDAAELALDHAQRMFDLGANACLDSLHLLGDRVLRTGPIEQLAQPRPHSDMPMRPDALGILALVDTLVTGIGEHVGFLSVHERVRLGHVVDVGRLTA